MKNIKTCFQDNERFIPLITWIILVICFIFNFNNLEQRTNILFLVFFNSIFLRKDATYQYAMMSVSFLIIVRLFIMFVLGE